MLEYFFNNFFIGYLFEFLAAICGTIYVFKKPFARKIIKIFVFFLWATLFIDLAGLYTVYAYFTGYEKFSFIKGTVFQRNFWLQNSFRVVTYLIFFIFFIRILPNEKLRKVFKVLVVLFTITSVLNLVFSGIFFLAFSAYSEITGTLLLMLVIAAYYYELLNSDKILKSHKLLVFYISVGVLIWHLVMTPLFIYSNYFFKENPQFISMHAMILQWSNIFMYSCFTLGFLICSRKKNFYS